MKPKPAPATPAATPMAGKHLPIVSTDGRFLSCSCGFTIGTIDTSANARQITEGCAYLFAGHVAKLQPAAAQPQRESEIPAGLIEELDRQVHGNDSGWHACVLCGCPERGAHFPACIVAKMRQRESEQP